MKLSLLFFRELQRVSRTNQPTNKHDWSEYLQGGYQASETDSKTNNGYKYKFWSSLFSDLLPAYTLWTFFKDYWPIYPVSIT